MVTQIKRFNKNPVNVEPGADETLGLVFCNLPYGAEYTLQAEVQGLGGGFCSSGSSEPMAIRDLELRFCTCVR